MAQPGEAHTLSHACLKAPKRILDGASQGCMACVLTQREFLWHELAAIRGIWDDQWVIGGDFNVCRCESERYNCIRRSRAMKSFTNIIHDLGIIDLPLQGAHYTWFRGEDSL